MSYPQVRNALLISISLSQPASLTLRLHERQNVTLQTQTGREGRGMEGGSDRELGMGGNSFKGEEGRAPRTTAAGGARQTTRNQGQERTSRTGPFTLRMMRRFWSSRNFTRTCVTWEEVK